MINGMLKLRVTVVLLLIWLAALFNIERLHEPINLASFVYVLAGLLAAAIVMAPKLRKLKLLEVSLVTLAAYGLLKWSLGYTFLGPHLPITVTECVVLCITNVLAWGVAYQIDDFLHSASEISMVQSCQDLLSLEEGEGRLYGEVQRARRFQRTLTLASLSFSGGFKAEQVDLLTRQARVEIARRFLESRVATSLLRLVGPGDLIVQDDGEFVLLFPEVAADAVRPRLESVARELREELGITLRWGAAEFPDQECTLTGLMELAAADANGSDECRQPASGNQVAAGQLAGETGLAD